MATRHARVLAQSWLSISAGCCPIGGGLIKLGHGSNAAALTVAIAPCVICALLCCIFAIGYLTATLRYLWTGDPQREFITVSANAMVSILSRQPTSLPAPAGHHPARARPGHVRESVLPRQRTRAGTPKTPR